MGESGSGATKSLGAMTIVNALFCATFLILVAASAAVAGSMIVLALFDRAFAKKRKPLVHAEGAETYSNQIDPPSVAMR